VFFIRAHDAKSLDDALFKIATSIGPSILASRHPRPYLPDTWSRLQPEEKIREFKTWLGDVDNESSLFIVDDLDGFSSDNAIQAALPRNARTILYSTRDPSIMMDLQRGGNEFRLAQMCEKDMALLMRDVLRRGARNLQENVSDEDLQAVAKVLHGNALAACRAIFYMVQEMDTSAEGSPTKDFIEMIRGPSWQIRKEFFNYKPRFATHSIMECFEVSLQRLRRDQDATQTFLNMIGFLSGSLGNTELSLDFNVFLSVERPWLSELADDLSDPAVFTTSSRVRKRYLVDLENVAIVFSASPTAPLHIHPVWVECIQQRVEQEGRLRWLRQVYLLCEASISREEVNKIMPFRDNCLQIAARFGITLHELAPSEFAKRWLEEATTRRPHEMPLSDPVGSEERTKARQEALSLRNDCNSAAESVSEDVVSGSEEDFAEQRIRMISLLSRLKNFHETNPNWREDDETARMYAEVFDILASIAFLLRSRNPRLGSALQKMKENLFGAS
jgi:hypothetical protein